MSGSLRRGASYGDLPIARAVGGLPAIANLHHSAPGHPDPALRSGATHGRHGAAHVVLIAPKCVALFCAISLLVASATRSSAADPDLKGIAQTLNRWRASFVTIHMVWERRDPYDVKTYAKELAAEGPLENVFHREDWIWTDYGASRLDSWLIAHGRIRHHHQWAADGRRLEAFRGLTRDSDSPRPQHGNYLQLFPMRSAKPSSSLAVRPLDDVYFEGSVQWLGELLAAGAGRLLGYESKDGVRCAHVKFSFYRPEVADRDSLEYADHDLWLDPTADFLPRRVHQPKGKSTAGSDFVVEEFQRLDSGIAVPKRGTFYGTWEPPGQLQPWIVTRVEVNKPIDDALFRPPTPVAGTHVVDALHGGGSYIVGEKPVPAAWSEAKIAEAAKANAASGPRVTAVVPASRMVWGAGALVLTSIALLCVGIWLRVRR
jgi:hypothetical protein